MCQVEEVKIYMDVYQTMTNCAKRDIIVGAPEFLCQEKRERIKNVFNQMVW